MPDQRNMLDQTKMTAPIPAVGAAGEQSNNNKTNDIIPKDRKNNNSLHTLSMTELYDTTYPPKAAIIDGLLYAGAYLFVGAPKIGKSFGNTTCIRARCCISPLRTITPVSRNACTRCSVRKIRQTCILRRSP